MSLPPARSLAERARDTRDRLERDVDCWVATASDSGPVLVPLSFLWDGAALWLSTALETPTGRNLRDRGVVRLALGQTRDVVLVDGTVTVHAASELPEGLGDAFAVKTGFDPRELDTAYGYYRVHPTRIRAWREVNETAGSQILRDGRWLDHDRD
jgi:general stress protein 26